MKVVAVIPVKGRLPLLKHTIQRLYRKNGVYKVICVGDSFEDKTLCEYEGAQFVTHPNNPLGKKWNRGFWEAKKYNPDAVLFVGSSDWISDNWIETMSPYLEEFDLVGKPDFQLLDIGPDNQYRFCHWKGYGKGPRENEPIGIGRLVSARILDKLAWSPMRPDLNSSMDFSMYSNVLALGGKVALVNGNEAHALSVSTYRWPNKHKFNDHYANKLPSGRRADFMKFLDESYPEYKMIFK
jgi:hypothetical protein